MLNIDITPHSPKPAIGSRVEVYSFGVWTGEVSSHEPAIQIQGRTRRPSGWVSVLLDDGRTWNGTAQDVSFLDAGCGI